MRGGAEWDGIRVAEADFHDAFHPAHAPFVPPTASAQSRVCRSGIAGAYGRYATSGSDCVGGLVRAENEDNGLTASARCAFAVRVLQAYTADARLPAMFVGMGLSTRKARTTCRRRARSRGCRSDIVGAYGRYATSGSDCVGGLVRAENEDNGLTASARCAFAVRVLQAYTADARLPAMFVGMGLSTRKARTTCRRRARSRGCRSGIADAQECRSRIDRLLSHSGSFAGAYSRRAYCGAGCEGARNGTESAWRKPIFTMRFISGGIPPSRR